MLANRNKMEAKPGSRGAQLWGDVRERPLPAEIFLPLPLCGLRVPWAYTRVEHSIEEWRRHFHCSSQT